MFIHKFIELPSFDLLGFTQVVQSGGELFEVVWSDGRWEQLKQLADSDKSIYGVASLDRACPKGYYRYTLAVLKPADKAIENTSSIEVDAAGDQLFSFHVKQSKWVAFTLEHFTRQYGEFWQQDPYKMIERLGFSYNKSLSIHIDVYPETYTAENDRMEFWMPVRG